MEIFIVAADRLNLISILFAAFVLFYLLLMLIVVDLRNS